MQHCRHIETQSNHVVTGAYILIRAPTEELDNSDNGPKLHAGLVALRLCRDQYC